MVIDQDDGIRPGTTPASLGQLRPVFKKGGSTTAGNSSQVGARAAAVLGGLTAGRSARLAARLLPQPAARPPRQPENALSSLQTCHRARPPPPCRSPTARPPCC